jgi:hypothetical protein
MSDNHSPARVLSGAERDFHRNEAFRLRALAKTITTKAMKERMLRQAQEHGRLVGLRLED